MPVVLVAGAQVLGVLGAGADAVASQQWYAAERCAAAVA